MSRPIKWRKICCMPLNKTFAPSGSKPQGKITMTIDEYETIRLMDLENVCLCYNLPYQGHGEKFGYKRDLGVFKKLCKT